MRLIGAILAIGFAVAIVYVSMIVVGLSCDGSESCSPSTKPFWIGLLGRAGLAGVIGSTFLVRRAQDFPGLGLALLTIIAYVAWTLIFLSGISEGPPTANSVVTEPVSELASTSGADWGGGLPTTSGGPGSGATWPSALSRIRPG